MSNQRDTVQTAGEGYYAPADQHAASRDPTVPRSVMRQATAVLGIDLACRDGSDIGPALIGFEGRRDTEVVPGAIAWPTEDLTPSAAAAAIDTFARTRGNAVVSVDGPQGWRDPAAPGRSPRRSMCATRSRGSAPIAILIPAGGGSLPDVWIRFGKPDGLFIDANDVLYLTDANSRPGANTGWEQGIRIGDAGTGWVEAIIPSPSPADVAGGWEGVTADIHGDICAAEPRPSMDVRGSQHVRRLVNVRARLQERGGR